MHSRSHILINRELKKIQQFQPWGIDITTRNSIFKWDVTIHGLKNTQWQDSELNMRVEFTEHFNDICPDVYFQTIPFHPNIDPDSGRPCMDCLADNWKHNMNLLSVFISIQYMLTNPETKNGDVLNLDAAYLYDNNRSQYEEIVFKSTEATKVHTPLVIKESIKESSKSKRNEKISFEDYHMTWRHLATSSVRSTLQSVEADNNQEKMFCVSESQVKDDMKTTPKQIKKDTIIQNKIKKINKMKNIYLEARNSPRKIKRDDEISDLIQWTEGLNEDEI